MRASEPGTLAGDADQGELAMAEDQPKPSGPDLAQGLPEGQLPDGSTLVGHVGDDEVLLVRRGADIFAIGAYCTHYHGPLVDGMVVDETVRCPWHHACFNLRTGEALRAPALEPGCRAGSSSARWQDLRGRETAASRAATTASPQRVLPAEIVIVGGGAAGFAAAEMLRRRDYQGSIVMLSADDALPFDRPNLSKDYLAGNAPEDWVPLRARTSMPSSGIDVQLTAAVAVDIDAGRREVMLADGGKVMPTTRLLLATGAEPVRLSIPGADLPHVHTLRSLADCRVDHRRRQRAARRAVVIGASFIGLEVAASLRAREIEVHVVAPEKRPMERILGRRDGRFRAVAARGAWRGFPPREHRRPRSTASG